MAWHFTDDVEAYASRVVPLLTVDPVRYTLPLTIIEACRARGAPIDPPETFGWWETADGSVTGAVSHTPPFPMVLAVVPDEAMRPLVHAVHELPRPIDTVDGTVVDAAHYATFRVNDLGGRAELRHMMRLHLLERLQPPPSALGVARTATADDRAVLNDWMKAFADEARTSFSPRVIDERLGYGGFTIWSDEAGQAVSLAGRTRPAAGVVRIGPVYTPPEHRRNGFGSAVTHACTQAALTAGAAGVCLFTDVANPTANAIYGRLGFRPVSETAQLHFID